MIKYHFFDDLDKTKELLTMITQTVPKERYGKLSMSDWMLNENKELRKISKLNEASLVKKDKQISVMRDELSRKVQLPRPIEVVDCELFSQSTC